MRQDNTRNFFTIFRRPDADIGRPQIFRKNWPEPSTTLTEGRVSGKILASIGH